MAPVVMARVVWPPRGSQGTPELVATPCAVREVTGERTGRESKAGLLTSGPIP
jgi:hypothetical protein